MTINNPMAGAQPPKPPRPWYTRWWVWVIAAAVLLFFVLPAALVVSVIASGDYEETQPTEAAVVESSTHEPSAPAEEATDEPSEAAPSAATAAPEETAEAEDESAATEPTGSLPDRVEAAVLESNGVSGLRELSSTSPGFFIAELEGVGSSTVRMHVQTQLADNDERDQFARWLYNHACSAVPELDTVVVRDLGGRDHNWYASRNVTACG